MWCHVLYHEIQEILIQASKMSFICFFFPPSFFFNFSFTIMGVAKGFQLVMTFFFRIHSTYPFFYIYIENKHFIFTLIDFIQKKVVQQSHACHSFCIFFFYDFFNQLFIISSKNQIINIKVTITILKPPFLFT